jgi:hypothetical protein
MVDVQKIGKKIKLRKDLLDFSTQLLMKLYFGNNGI